MPAEYFVGRTQEKIAVIEDGLVQVRHGRSASIFVEGAFGIGKTSFSRYISEFAIQNDYPVHVVYVTLGGVASLDDFAKVIVEATMTSGAFDPSRGEAIRNWLSKYVGKQEAFGFTINLEMLQQDLPALASPFGTLSFLREGCNRLSSTGVAGILLVFDEIDLLSGNPQFAHFIKALIDGNAMSQTPIPLLLMMCGVADCRRRLIANHKPVERIFEVVRIDVLSDEDVAAFFDLAFTSVGNFVEDSAYGHLMKFSAGIPYIMHEIGAAAFRMTTTEDIITEEVVQRAIVAAADAVGAKFVDQQIIASLRVPEFRAILRQIGGLSPTRLTFGKEEVFHRLKEEEQYKVEEVLGRLKNLGLISDSTIRGEYEFISPMARLYLWLSSERETYLA